MCVHDVLGTPRCSLAHPYFYIPCHPRCEPGGAGSARGAGVGYCWQRFQSFAFPPAPALQSPTGTPAAQALKHLQLFPPSGHPCGESGGAGSARGGVGGAAGCCGERGRGTTDAGGAGGRHGGGSAAHAGPGGGGRGVGGQQGEEGEGEGHWRGVGRGIWQSNCAGNGRPAHDEVSGERRKRQQLGRKLAEEYLPAGGL